MIVTKHALSRLAERVGILDPISADVVAELAWQNGTPHRWTLTPKGRYAQKTNEPQPKYPLRTYHGHVYVFAVERGKLVLVTVFVLTDKNKSALVSKSGDVALKNTRRRAFKVKHAISIVSEKNAQSRRRFTLKWFRMRFKLLCKQLRGDRVI